MAHEALVRAELASGRLVAPFETRVTLPRALSVASAAKAKKGSAADRVVALLRA